MSWDSVGRRYLPTQSAFAAYARLNSAESAQAFNAYVGQKGAAAFGDGSSDMLCSALPFSVPDPQIFSVFRQASESSRAAEVVYQSMQNPQPHLRIIEPHHLVQAGRRWHARAFCRTSNEYRDYALGRVISAKLLQEKGDHGVANDIGWQTTVPLELIPHPLLSADQAQVVCFENFAGKPQRLIACRAALIHYLIQAVRAAVSPDDQRPPDYQLAVRNAGSLQTWLFQGSTAIEAG